MNDGITVELQGKEILIRGTKEDLLELSNTIQELANSNNIEDHIHLDEFTLLSNNSSINILIIEKEKSD